MSIPDWSVGEASIDVQPVQVGPQGPPLASIQMHIPVRRLVLFYILKVAFPLSLIVLMSWAVFWIDAGHVPPRIIVASTSILTVTAYQFVLARQVPRLSYLTRMDLYLIGSSTLVFLALVVAVLTTHLHGSGKPEQAVKVNRVSRRVFPVVFIAILVTSFVI